MSGAFGQRLAKVLASPPREEAGRARAQRIVVPDSAYLSGRPADLVAAVGDFVRFALDRAVFLPEELNPDAIGSFRAETYRSEVRAGGHSQYASTSGLDRALLGSCQRTLEAMQHGALDIHRAFVDRVEAEPRRMEAVRRDGGLRGVDAAMAELDMAFRVAELEFTLVEAHAAWLRTLPALDVVPDHELRAALNGFAGANGEAATRRARRHKAGLEAAKRDPLKQALTFLCSRAEEPRRFLAWHRGVPGNDLGDGVKVVRFLVETDKGMCSAFFHPRVSVLLDGEGHARQLARIPSEQVISHVARQTGRSLMEVLGQ